jgi:hypothetical protein
MAKDKSILMQTQTETDRNATTRLRLFVRPEEMGGGRIIARHAYRYINEHFAPGMGDKVSYNSVNCFYPFMDASVYQGSPGTSTTPPAFGGYVKIDYALPTPIAEVLMQSITSHQGRCSLSPSPKLRTKTPTLLSPPVTPCVDLLGSIIPWKP